MTQREIIAAVRSGHAVRLPDDPQAIVCINLFGELIVESRAGEDTTRLMTLADKRKAEVGSRGRPPAHPPERLGVVRINEKN